MRVHAHSHNATTKNEGRPQKRTALMLVVRKSSGLVPVHEAVDEEDQQGAEDGEHQPLEGEDFVVLDIEDESAEESTEECTHDSENHGDEEAAALLSRKDGLGNCASEEADDDVRKNCKH